MLGVNLCSHVPLGNNSDLTIASAMKENLTKVECLKLWTGKTSYKILQTTLMHFLENYSFQYE